MSGNATGAVLLASFLACAVTTVGISFISRYELWAREHSAYFSCFAAGVLISVSLVHIVPRSLEMNGSAPMFWLAGFLAIHLVNRFLTLFVCQRTEYKDHVWGIIPLLGIGFHSLIDGVIYAVTFNVSVLTGALAAVGMVLHEFPEGIVTFVLLDRSGFGRRRAFLYAFLAAGLSTPLGTVLSLPLMRTITRPALGALLALSAGVLIYVGACHLLPQVEKENKRYSVLALAAGVLVAIVIVLSQA